MQVKMKRHYIYIGISITVLSVISCNKWLDIVPEDTTVEKQLFNDAGGYHSAINGLYQEMASPDLYGENLTWGFASALSQYYDNNSVSKTLKFSYTEQYEYDSDEVKAFGEQIWQKAYNIIANSNNILKHLETQDMSIFPRYEFGEADVIKGEALAVRAMMHFELLRLFSVAPVTDMNAKAIPYVSVFPAIFSDRLTNKEVLEKIVSDLEESSRLLAKNDTLIMLHYLASTENRFSGDKSRDYGLFLTARGFRMNYYAIVALLARVNAYAGDIDKAYEWAKIIDSNAAGGRNFFKYTKEGFSPSDLETTRPHKLMDEILIGLYRENLVQEYTSVAFLSGSNNPYKLKNFSYLFPDNDDYRKIKFVKDVSRDVKISSKYFQVTESSKLKVSENRTLPVMRLSEIYFIMAEYLAKSGNVKDAVKLLTKLRTARGCLVNKLDENMSEADFYKALDGEILRENVAEGQYFFYCKRIDAPTINNGGVNVQMKGKYTLLIPDSQTVLNQ